MARNSEYPSCFGLWYGTRPECAMCRFKILCEWTIGHHIAQQCGRAHESYIKYVTTQEPPENCFGKYYGMYLRCATCPFELLCEWTYRYMKQLYANSRVIVVPRQVQYHT